MINELLKKNSDINIVVIEASDGIECLAALYNADINSLKVCAVISDENMSYMNGNFYYYPETCIK